MAKRTLAFCEDWWVRLGHLRIALPWRCDHFPAFVGAYDRFVDCLKVFWFGSHCRRVGTFTIGLIWAVGHFLPALLFRLTN